MHGLVFSKIGLIDLTGDLLGPRLQLLLELLLTAKQIGVLGKLLAETGDMRADFAKHGLIAGVGYRSLQLLDQGSGLFGLFDAPLARIFGALAVLLQAHPRLIHGLQHQAGNLSDLPGLLYELGALLALGVLEGIGAVIGQPRLQHIEVVGNTGD
ncbi:hypothetical protein D3C79_709950 [compost metagenome]